MTETILISLPVKELQTLIIDCVNVCLQNKAISGNAEPEQDQLLTIQQAAELLNLSVPTIYGLVSRSVIPVSKKGKRLYFSKQELLNWIKEGRKKTKGEIEAEAQEYINRKRK